MKRVKSVGQYGTDIRLPALGRVKPPKGVLYQGQRTSWLGISDGIPEHTYSMYSLPEAA
jgi:hypothetical protein